MLSLEFFCNKDSNVPTLQVTLCRTPTSPSQQQGNVSGGPSSLSLERPPLTVLHVAEGLALVVLCSVRPATRRLAVNVLREVRALAAALGIAKVTAAYSKSHLACYHPCGSCMLI